VQIVLENEFLPGVGFEESANYVTTYLHWNK